jgi:nucleotide-binding universal stress UspA family protein
MFKQILLPTDGSDLSERAILAGISFAKGLGAFVIGLTVIPEFKVFTIDPELLEETEEEHYAKSQQEAAKRLAVISDNARLLGVKYDCLQVINDHPWEAILQVARDRGCDLITMASHGRSGIKGLLLGSETQKVLVHTSIPVLVYR